MPGNQDWQRQELQKAVDSAQKARNAFNTKQYESGDSGRQATADRNLAEANRKLSDFDK